MDKWPLPSKDIKIPLIPSGIILPLDRRIVQAIFSIVLGREQNACARSLNEELDEKDQKAQKDLKKFAKAKVTARNKSIAKKNEEDSSEKIRKTGERKEGRITEET